MSTPAAQLTFDELDDPLREITFVVLDLETTGGSAHDDEITEIGAVKVRGGVECGSFATLVNPGRAIPPQITALTGITDSTVAQAPTLTAVLPGLLEFLRGSVLVAHNAPFDIGFLRAACARRDVSWPNLPVVDTVRLARQVLPRSQAPSVRLAVLAPLLGSQVIPDHRALTDARATVDVLHALLELVGPRGVHSLPELLAFCRGGDSGRRNKRQLAAGLPEAPGVYLFRGPADEVLYVGTSKNIRRRVRSYFTTSQQRARISQMLTLAQRVEAVVCAHPLEAQIREQRLIAAHQPPYNRRSRRPHQVCWITLTAEPFPRLSIVSRRPPPGRLALGPFTSRTDATDAVDAICTALPIRRCTLRIRRSHPDLSPCALAELAQCAAPCAGGQSETDYATGIHRLSALVEGYDDSVLTALHQRLTALGQSGRFDAAATLRNRLAAVVSGLDRCQRLAALTGIAELVGAQRCADGSWELAVIRYGYLAGAGRCLPGADPWRAVDELRTCAQQLPDGAGPGTAATAEESSTILRWLESGATRLVYTSQGWASPVAGAGRHRWLADAAQAAKGALRSSQVCERGWA